MRKRIVCVGFPVIIFTFNLSLFNLSLCQTYHGRNFIRFSGLFRVTPIGGNLMQRKYSMQQLVDLDNGKHFKIPQEKFCIDVRTFSSPDII